MKPCSMKNTKIVGNTHYGAKKYQYFLVHQCIFLFLNSKNSTFCFGKKCKKSIIENHEHVNETSMVKIAFFKFFSFIVKQTVGKPIVEFFIRIMP